jgi:hypothetical protein
MQSQIDERSNEHAEASHNQQMAQLREQYRKANDEGDNEALLDIQDKMLDLKMERRLNQQRAGAGQTDQAREEPPEAQNGAPQQGQGIPPATQRWLRANTWFMNGTNPEAIQTASIIEARLLQQNYDPQSDEFYKVMDNQLHRFHPELAEGGQTGHVSGAGEGKKQGGAPAANESGGPTNGVANGGARRGKANRVTLTHKDLANMRRFGLDPDDPEHIKNYAREKRAMAQNGRAA